MTMRTLVALMAAVATGPLVWDHEALAQAPYGPMPSGGMPARASLIPTGQPELVDAHGDAAVIPAQYCESCQPGYGNSCPPNAYGGGGYYDSMDSPYGGIGFGVEQCGPHYFDISFEFVYLQRDSTFKNQVAFTAENFNTDGSPPNLVLTSSDLDHGSEPGFRIVGRYDIGPLSVLEFGYAGFYDMNDAASYSDPNVLDNGLGNLFSPFTNFGDGFLPESDVDPIEGGFDPDNLEDFEETDRASTHSIVYNSDLQTAEISWRRYWLGGSPRVSGTILAGFRYTKLKESFNYTTVGVDFLPGATPPPTSPPLDPNMPDGIGTAEYRIHGDNNLAGFQLGGDGWVCVAQGLRLGAEAKAGIYNNRYSMLTTFETSDGDPSLFEEFRTNQVAFISEGRLMVVADLLPSLSIKGGYEVLFLNSLALVGDNFNAASPYDNVNVPTRVAKVNDQGDALFHGWNCGLEYIW